MPEEELWKTFDTDPEGLNQAEVRSVREQHGENKLPANDLAVVGLFMGLLSQPL
ncbi:cation-transporting P-type ATPase [Escherichia coli]